MTKRIVVTNIRDTWGIDVPDDTVERIEKRFGFSKYGLIMATPQQVREFLSTDTNTDD